MGIPYRCEGRGAKSAEGCDCPGLVPKINAGGPCMHYEVEGDGVLEYAKLI